MHAAVEPLANALRESYNGSLTVFAAGIDCPTGAWNVNSVSYINKQESRTAFVYGVGRASAERKMLQEIVEQIEAIRPDIVHIHGTEKYYGEIASSRRNYSVVISIQGILKECARRCWGDLGITPILANTGYWELSRGLPSVRLHSLYRRGAVREQKSLLHANRVLGRTDWDRAYCAHLCPHTPYSHVDEILRPEFFEASWAADEAHRYRIFTSGRLTLMKGMHVLVDAIAIARERIPKIHLTIAGDIVDSAEFRFIKRKIKRHGLTESVCLAGWLDGKAIVKALMRSRAFVTASFVENGCNSLQEAMALGVPTICTFAGGMTTTTRHGETGVMVPVNDPLTLADSIVKVCTDDNLANRISRNAAALARQRHSASAIIQQMLTAYKETHESKLV